MGQTLVDTSGVTAPTKGELTRRAILDAAIARFAREGYRATSVADIARDAGVGGTVAYAYFPNKEALFLAAADEDAAAVINEGVAGSLSDPAMPDWRGVLMTTLVAAVERHPLARRLLAGLEPEFTVRMIETPALAELRKAAAERLRSEQLADLVRNDFDPVVIANGIVSVTLMMLMAFVQLGGDIAEKYGDDIISVFEAAIGPSANRFPDPATSST